MSYVNFAKRKLFGIMPKFKSETDQHFTLDHAKHEPSKIRGKKES